MATESGCDNTRSIANEAESGTLIVLLERGVCNDFSTFWAMYVTQGLF